MLIDCRNEAEWLDKRRSYLTASDAANYCGINPYDPDGRIRLWQEKTDPQTAKSIVSSLKAVRFGKEAEEHIRDIFLLRHFEYMLEYHQYGLYVSEDHPFMAATLDGMLHDIQTHDQIILEIKTATVRSSEALKEWRNGKIPINYWCQEIHQQICVPQAIGTWTAALVSTSWNPTESYYLEIYHAREEMDKDRPVVLNHAYEMHRLIEAREKPATVIRI